MIRSNAAIHVRAAYHASQECDWQSAAEHYAVAYASLRSHGCTEAAGYLEMAEYCAHRAAQRVAMVNAAVQVSFEGSAR